MDNLRRSCLDINKTRLITAVTVIRSYPDKDLSGPVAIIDEDYAFGTF